MRTARKLDTIDKGARAACLSVCLSVSHRLPFLEKRSLTYLYHQLNRPIGRDETGSIKIPRFGVWA